MIHVNLIGHRAPKPQLARLVGALVVVVLMAVAYKFVGLNRTQQRAVIGVLDQMEAKVPAVSTITERLRDLVARTPRLGAPLKDATQSQPTSGKSTSIESTDR